MNGVPNFTSIAWPYMGIYILDGNTGAIIAGLNTNGISGGTYTPVVPGVSDDGVVYVCNQVSGSSATTELEYRLSPLRSSPL